MTYIDNDLCPVCEFQKPYGAPCSNCAEESCPPDDRPPPTPTLSDPGKHVRYCG